ncbi:MAG: Na+/H+ antiporter NhaA [Acidimicrobiales bacterium]
MSDGAPGRRFVTVERSGGLLLVLAVAGALVWANSPWRASYQQLWALALPLRLDLRGWVGDGLMTFFFLVAGLEVRRELATGELRGARRAAFPVAAAVGGMAVPALLYLAWNRTGPVARGWGVPMPTDLAFALGVLVLLGERVPRSLRVFLLSLAIVDDLLSLVVIAVVYSNRVRWGPLGGSVLAVVALVVVARRPRPAVRSGRLGPARATGVGVVGALLWFALHRSGVNPTLAGVAVAMAVPAGSLASGTSDRGAADVVRLERWLHPLSSLVVVPIFVLANAGIPLGRHVLGPALGSGVALGVVAGKVIGKPVGITVAALAVRRAGLADLPAGAGLLELLGVAAVAGVGFTVSLFFVALALPAASPSYQAKVGILAGSVLAAAVGGAILGLAGTRRRRSATGLEPGAG